MVHQIYKLNEDVTITKIDVTSFEYPQLNIELLGTADDLIQRVRPKGFAHLQQDRGMPVLLVDEEGLYKKLEFNPIASLLYGAHVHGQPIVGPAYVVWEHVDYDGEDSWSELPDDITADVIKLAAIAAYDHPELFR